MGMTDPTEIEAFAEAGMDWPDENAEPDAPERKGFVIDTDAAATKVLRRLERWEREAARLQRLAADERALIESFVAANLGTRDEPKGAAREVAFYRGVLVDYYRRLEDHDPAIDQTYKVPGGWMGRRKNPDTVEVSNGDAFVQWAIENDRTDLIAEIAPAGKAALKGGLNPQADPKKAARGERLHFIDENGAVIPGVMYVVGDDRYEAKVAAAEVP